MRKTLLASVLLLACSSGTSAPATPGNDSALDSIATFDTSVADGAGEASAGDAPDAVAVEDSALPATTEKEPNNAETATEVNAVAIPGVVTGAIDPADDLDVLSVTLTAGDVWSWDLVGTGGGMTPHLGISQNGNRVPTMVALGTVQEHFVLESEKYFLIVRDARNVPASTSKKVGGASLTWKLTARPLTRPAATVTFPESVSGKLATRTSIALYAFTGTKDFGFDIVLRARRKTPASDLDSRMSLYEKTTKRWILTNDDDAAAATKDSHIGGVLPFAGEYVVIVENVSPDAADLSFELQFTKR